MRAPCLRDAARHAGPGRFPLTWALGFLWSAGNVAYKVLPLSVTEHVELVASTSLPNLRAWPVALPLSGLLVPTQLWLWLLALAVGVAAVEQALGTRRTLVALLAVHVGGTVLSQGVLLLRVAAGSAPRALLDQLDVGPSYLAVGGLVLAVVLARQQWSRMAALLAVAVGLPKLTEGLRHLELEDTGHLASVVLALGIGLWWRRDARPVVDRVNGRAPG